MILLEEVQFKRLDLSDLENSDGCMSKASVIVLTPANVRDSALWCCPASAGVRILSKPSKGGGVKIVTALKIWLFPRNSGGKPVHRETESVPFTMPCIFEERR